MLKLHDYIRRFFSLSIKSLKSFFYLCTICLLLFVSYCKFVDIGAPGDASIYITAIPMNIGSGEISTIKVGGYNSNGTSLKNGIVIQLSTNFGTIDEKITISEGVAFGTFKSPANKSGIAEITARSGGAEEKTININVGAVALSKLIITANPQSLPENGGTSQITVSAFDLSLNPLKDVPVIITADSGNLQNGGKTLYTDLNGQVFDTLNTMIDTIVTAETPGLIVDSGGSSTNITAETTIKVEKAETVVSIFTYYPSAPKVGTIVYFNGSASEGTDLSYEWDFGDGRFGSGARSSHRYSKIGTYNVILAVTNSFGATKYSSSKPIPVSDALANLIITADPQTLPLGGGESEITVSVFNYDNEPLRGVPITFKTDKGSMLNGGKILYTDANGQVSDTLDTTETATITVNILESNTSTADDDTIEVEVKT